VKINVPNKKDIEGWAGSCTISDITKKAKIEAAEYLIKWIIKLNK